VNEDQWRLVLNLEAKGAFLKPFLEIYSRILDVEYVSVKSTSNEAMTKSPPDAFCSIGYTIF
jgi:hypothetical protein